MHPRSASRSKPVKYDKRRYIRRNRIEIMFGRLKDWRRVATRYYRCQKVFLSAVEAGRAFGHDGASMSKIIVQTKQAVNGFADRMTAQKTEWATSDSFNLADVFWGVSLFRLNHLGYAWMRDHHPHLDDYTHRTYSRPPVRAGVTNWPGHPPGDTIADIV